MSAPVSQITSAAPARPADDAVDDVELAFARLEWVRAARCLDLPSQREALQWHAAYCEAALAAAERHAASEGAGR